MTDTIIELTEEEFAALYPLRTNSLDPAAGWNNGEGGCLFETYGEELAFVQSQDPRTVWTFMEGDDGAQYVQYVLSGFHLVNRIGYLISTVPIPQKTTIKVCMPIQSEEDAEATAHTPEPWRIHRLNNGWPVITSDAHDIADLRLNGKGLSHFEANARRICTAVNACEGISTEALANGIVSELLEVLDCTIRCLETVLAEQNQMGRKKGVIEMADHVLANATGRAV